MAAPCIQIKVFYSENSSGEGIVGVEGKGLLIEEKKVGQ